MEKMSARVNVRESKIMHKPIKVGVRTSSIVEPSSIYNMFSHVLNMFQVMFNMFSLY